MTIRFTCAQCASVLKIKEELAGTSGRCPKCKTKFIVPEPGSDEGSSQDFGVVDVEKNGLRRQDESASDHSGLKREFADETTEESSSKDPAGWREDAIAAGFNPAETLRLEDSDEEIETLNEVVPKSIGRAIDAPSDDSASTPIAVTAEEPAVTTTESEEEDLDSPPMMVAHPMLAATVLIAKSLGSQVHADRLPALDKASKVPNKTSSSEKPVFDPAKFLMSDRPLVAPPPDPTPALSPSYSPGRPPLYHHDEEIDYSVPPDSDTDLLSPPSPIPVSRPTPAPRPPRPQPEKIDLATAAKMMKKAIKDSQAEEAHQRELDAKAGFDFGQILRDIGPKGFAIVAGCVVLIPLLYFMANRMFSNPLKLPPLAYVRGVVKLDGNPLPGAMVNMAPVEPEIQGSKKERMRTSVAVSDDNGQFRMMYIPADRIEGVAAGKVRVWVTHVGPKGRSDVPPEWSEGAVMIKEFTRGHQKTPFDINMESKSR
jgi:hypothetical protein